MNTVSIALSTKPINHLTVPFADFGSRGARPDRKLGALRSPRLRLLI
jgi:hypothetical protein